MIVDLTKPDSVIRDALIVLKISASVSGGSEEFYREALNRVARWLESQLIGD